MCQSVGTGACATVPSALVPRPSISQNKSCPDVVVAAALFEADGEAAIAQRRDDRVRLRTHGAGGEFHADLRAGGIEALPAHEAKIVIDPGRDEAAVIERGDVGTHLVTGNGGIDDQERGWRSGTVIDARDDAAAAAACGGVAIGFRPDRDETAAGQRRHMHVERERAAEVATPYESSRRIADLVSRGEGAKAGLVFIYDDVVAVAEDVDIRVESSADDGGVRDCKFGADRAGGADDAADGTRAKRTAGLRGASVGDEVPAVGPDGDRRAGEGIGAGVGLDRGGGAADEAAVDVVALRADRGPGCIGVGVDHDEAASGPGVERRVLLVVGKEREIGPELGADAVAPCDENLPDQVRAVRGGDRTAGSFGPHHDVAAGADVNDLRIGLIAGVGEVRLLRRAPYLRRRGHDGICLDSSAGDDGESLRLSRCTLLSLRAVERFTPRMACQTKLYGLKMCQSPGTAACGTLPSAVTPKPFISQV